MHILLFCTVTNTNETLLTARHTLRLSTHRTSTTTASTHRLYIRPPYRTSWEL